MIPRVNLGESGVAALMNNKLAVATFPWLKDAPKIKHAGCGGCGAKLRESTDVNWVKRRIAALGKKEKAQIKQFLNAKTVVGTYRDQGLLKAFSF